MSNTFVLLLMIFLHIVDDFHLQGILADMKQKKWWESQTLDKKYRNDYTVALLVHSFEWAFLIMLPIAYMKNFQIGAIFGLFLLLNTALHAVIDDLKANQLECNLIEDQLMHIAQIFSTFIMYLCGDF